MQEIQLMKEMEALRAQLQQKEQALEDYKDSVEPRVPQHRRYSLPFQYLTYSVTDE